MAGDKPETIVRKYYEKATEGDAKAIDELLAADVVVYSPISDEPIRGIAAYKAMISAYRAATPELKLKVEDLQVYGDTVVARWSAHYKHSGPFEGHQPTGKSGDLAGSDTIRIVNGKIVEVRNTLDLATVTDQVGFKPNLKTTKK